METIDTSNMNETEPAKRPTFLTVLCILTFIWSSFKCISTLIFFLFPDKVMEFVKMNPKVTQEQIDNITTVVNAGWKFCVPSFLLMLLSFVGAFLMWGLKKTGFHLYTVSNLALLFLPIVMFGFRMDMFELFFTILFIILYALNFKHLS